MREDELFEKAWAIEEVLQSASVGDYTKRCDSSISSSFQEDPFATITPAINLLLSDLQAKERRQLNAEQQLKDTLADLQAKLDTIEEQAAEIRELSTPVMKVWDDVLALPIVGEVDTRRSIDIMTKLLESVAAEQAKYVILDITGVEMVDTRTADYLLKVVRAARLLGSLCVLTGLSSTVAQTLVEIGADLTEVTTLRNLMEGLKYCMAHQRRHRKN